MTWAKRARRLRSPSTRLQSARVATHPCDAKRKTAGCVNDLSSGVTPAAPLSQIDYRAIGEVQMQHQRFQPLAAILM
jgi:hypothetical protein